MSDGSGAWHGYSQNYPGTSSHSEPVGRNVQSQETEQNEKDWFRQQTANFEQVRQAENVNSVEPAAKKNRTRALSLVETMFCSQRGNEKAKDTSTSPPKTSTSSSTITGHQEPSPGTSAGLPAMAKSVTPWSRQGIRYKGSPYVPKCDICQGICKGTTSTKKLSLKEKQIVSARAQVIVLDICNKCYDKYLIRYEKGQKCFGCCDPYQIHSKKITAGIRPISLETYLKNKRFVPGKFWCSKCRQRASEEDINETPSVQDFAPHHGATVQPPGGDHRAEHLPQAAPLHEPPADTGNKCAGNLGDARPQPPQQGGGGGGHHGVHGVSVSLCRVHTVPLSLCPCEKEPLCGESPVENISDRENTPMHDSEELNQGSQHVWSQELGLEQVQNAMQELGESPVKPSMLKRTVYKTTKVKQITNTICKLLNISDQSEDNESFFESLKAQFDKAESNTDKYRILTSCPLSWGQAKLAEKFKISQRMAKHAVHLRHQNGPGSFPQPKKGKNLPDGVEERVKNFYKSGEISRMMPGKKDCIRVKDPKTGVKENKQKQMILSSIRETHAAFLNENKDVKIGFSTFAVLRPKVS